VQKVQCEKLYLFGSAVTGGLSEDSDLDFIVHFDRQGYEGAFEQFMGFKQHLEQIFDCSIDLYHQRKFRNPIFQQEVNNTKQLLYAV
jgi:predicted nucleotidyltransferase